eukprot:SM000310S11938  [mRNA]  locus=s310:126271:127833:+ [translate_table: standard]
MPAAPPRASRSCAARPGPPCPPCPDFSPSFARPSLRCRHSSLPRLTMFIARAAPGSTMSSSIDASRILTLDNIRTFLIRQEDSIIFNLIERSQYRYNPPTYDPTLLGIPGFHGSLLEYLLSETEQLHAKVRRYTSPDEHPFFPEALPPVILQDLEYPQVLHPAAEGINVNPQIWKMYLTVALPAITQKGDDGNYGSAATLDVLCLQALSRRIHYGKFVAEAKFQETPELYQPLIEAQDAAGLVELLTYEAVEKKVQQRVEEKAAIFGQDIEVGQESRMKSTKIEPRVVASLYGQWIMPLNKEVQVQYLLRRLDPA